jgi:phosphoesterase RecJ-like protein
VTAAAAAASDWDHRLDEGFAAAVQAVGQTPRDAPVLLACHVGPDGDALGSMLGFGLALRRLGFTAVSASFPEPFEVPDAFTFLPGLDLLVGPTDVPVRPALAVSFDAASPTRLAGLTDALEAAPTWVVVDHHASNVGFGSVRVVDPDAAATAALAADLIDRLGVEVDRDIATCLYVGLVTDTGSFKFDATTPTVLRLASRLVEAGVRPADVARRVFDTRPFAALRLLGDVLDRVELDRTAGGGRGLVMAYATMAELRHHGQSAQVLESFMDVIRTAAEADVACLVKPVAEGEWSVSLRSRGGTDVSSVAVALGGGGHRLAAGFTRRGDVADVLAAVRSELDRAAALVRAGSDDGR